MLRILGNAPGQKQKKITLKVLSVVLIPGKISLLLWFAEEHRRTSYARKVQENSDNEADDAVGMWHTSLQEPCIIVKDTACVDACPVGGCVRCTSTLLRFNSVAKGALAQM